MIVIDWSNKVNKNISIDGDFYYKEGFVETLEFESGKERTWLKNSFVPRVFPELSLLLNNQSDNINRTEYEEFVYWYDDTLRYGILPFYFPRFGYNETLTIKIGEIGIYKFIPDTLLCDRLSGIVEVKFGLEEIGFINEVQIIFLATENNEIFITDNSKLIII